MAGGVSGFALSAIGYDSLAAAQTAEVQGGIDVYKRQAIIILAAIATPIARSQHMREIWFYVMSGGCS